MTTEKREKPTVHWPHPELPHQEKGVSACGLIGVTFSSAINVNCMACRTFISKYVTELVNKMPPPRPKTSGSDTSFNYDGAHYISLMDFLLGGGGNDLVVIDLTQQREDRLRAAIAAYTEAVTERQAREDAKLDDGELNQAVKIIIGLVEWGNNVASRGGFDPWDAAQAFLDEPYVKVLRQQLKLAECNDHWHCDPSGLAEPCEHERSRHDATEPDRTLPCPGCKQPPLPEVFTETCLAALAELMQIVEGLTRIPSPENGGRGRSMELPQAQAVLAEGRKRGLL